MSVPSNLAHVREQVESFIKKHPVLTYYVLVFAISWGAILILLGPRGFLGTSATTPATSSTTVLAFSAAVLGPSVAGILLTILVDGRPGLRELLSRLRRWRVNARWYAVALLTAPLLSTATLLALSLVSPTFLPAILTTEDRARAVLSGIAVGLTVPFFEELGWTGFAMPRLRQRHGVLATGLVMGVLWGAWHFPAVAGSAASSGEVAPALLVAALLFSWLPPFRVLMVWVYDRTQSLLVVMLMHTQLVVGQYVLTPTGTSAPALVTHLVAFSAALWLLVAAVAVANGARIKRERGGPAQRPHHRELVHQH